MKKTIIPEALTRTEDFILSRHLSMNEHWFNSFFKDKLRYDSQSIVYWEKDTPNVAKIYAIDATINAGKEDERPGVYCYLIYFEEKVWKCDGVVGTAEIIEIIKKNYKREIYEENLEEIKFKKQIQKKKAVGKLKSITGKKKAA